MKNIIEQPGKTFHYWTPNGGDSVTLGVDGVIAVLVDDDGEVYEWFTNETYRDTVANFATYVANLHHLPIDDTNRNVIEIALRERALYADCFGLEIN